MSKTLCIVTAQYRENYGWSEGFVGAEAKWKNKGEATFHLQVEADHFLYAKEEAIQAISEMLKEQSNDAVDYSYVDHELVFHEPIQLSADEFESKFDAIIAADMHVEDEKTH